MIACRKSAPPTGSSSQLGPLKIIKPAGRVEREKADAAVEAYEQEIEDEETAKTTLDK